ncbi:hypothetical protein CC2G_011720 [Coprinopsis cinerea AmutBmut pab1-1]|nr:hypothetical protein CC2G_011720 [Coprinopsis cinerea AmutBmut pab1-1]
MIYNEKSSSASANGHKVQKRHYMAPGTPLSQRPMDLVYFLFFVSHIPFTLILDLQAVYPTWLLPEDSSLRALGAFYVSMTNDPIIGGVAGTFGEVTRRSMQWLLSFTYLELFFQLPTFFYAAYHLYHNRKLHVLYPLMAIYGASTATTTLPCIVLVLTTPPTGVATVLGSTVSSGQRLTLLASYLPYLLIPLVMAIDSAYRMAGLVSRALKEIKKEGKWD